MTWTLAPSNSSSHVRGALDCGNANQTVQSAVFGPFCSAIRTRPTCMAQAPRCTWQRTGCAQAAPPAPPPPPPAGHKYTVGEAKFYGTNLLCELDAPNEVRPLYHYPVPVYSDLLLRLLDWSLAPVLHRRADTDAVLLPTCPAEPVAGESFYHAAYGRRRHQWDLTHHSAWLGVPSLPWKRLVGHECHRCDLSENSVSESKCCELTVFLRWGLSDAVAGPGKGQSRRSPRFVRTQSETRRPKST